MIQREHHGIRAACAALAAAAALLCPLASATVINFESLPPSTYEGGVTLNSNGYNIALQEGPVTGAFGWSSAIGTIVNPADPQSCEIIACPAGSDGQYLAITNDGAVRFSHAGSSGGFRVGGLDFAFLAPLGIGDGDYGRLRLLGTDLNGNETSLELAFPGQNATGDFLFGAANLANDFRQLILSSLTIDACIFDADSVCVNSFDNPAMNQAQFALDNLNVSAVPEPGSLLLLAAGGALLIQRRRNSLRQGA